MDLSSFLTSVSDNAATLNGSQVTLWSSTLGLLATFIVGLAFTHQVTPSKQPSLSDVFGLWIRALLMGFVVGLLAFVVLSIHGIVAANLWATAGIVVAACLSVIFAVMGIIALEGPQSAPEQYSDDSL